MAVKVHEELSDGSASVRARRMSIYLYIDIIPQGAHIGSEDEGRDVEDGVRFTEIWRKARESLQG